MDEKGKAEDSAAKRRLSKPYLIVTLLKEKPALDALVKEFSGWEDITILNLLGPAEAISRKFINAHNIDIVIFDKEAAESGESSLVFAIAKKASLDTKAMRTYFLPLYNDESVRFMLEFNTVLGNMGLVMTSTRVEDEDDYENVMNINVIGMINRREQFLRRQESVVRELASELREIMYNESNHHEKT